MHAQTAIIEGKKKKNETVDNVGQENMFLHRIFVVFYLVSRNHVNDKYTWQTAKNATVP